MNVKNLKFKDNSFETSLLFEVLEHIDDLNACFGRSKKSYFKKYFDNCT